MRLTLATASIFACTICLADVPALPQARPLPNGCVIHALLYAAALDPMVGRVEIVKVAGGGGIPHVIAVVSTPDGARYGRDEDLGVFPLGIYDPQRAYDRARRDALALRRARVGTDTVGASEERRSLLEAHERLAAAGFAPQRVRDALVWRAGLVTYVYSPKRGCAEIRTTSSDVLRVAAAAMAYWKTRL